MSDPYDERMLGYWNLWFFKLILEMRPDGIVHKGEFIPWPSLTRIFIVDYWTGGGKSSPPYEYSILRIRLADRTINVNSLYLSRKSDPWTLKKFGIEDSSTAYLQLERELFAKCKERVIVRKKATWGLFDFSEPRGIIECVLLGVFLLTAMGPVFYALVRLFKN